MHLVADRAVHRRDLSLSVDRSSRPLRHETQSPADVRERPEASHLEAFRGEVRREADRGVLRRHRGELESWYLLAIVSLVANGIGTPLSPPGYLRSYFISSSEYRQQNRRGGVRATVRGLSVPCGLAESRRGDWGTCERDRRLVHALRTW